MVKLVITKDGTTVLVRKAVEKEIIDFLLNCPDSYQTRVNGWLKDFHIDDMDLFTKEQAIELRRKLEENKNLPIDLETMAEAMRNLMISFIEFAKSLIEENSEQENPTKQPAKEDAKPIKKFFHMEETENGLSMEGTISPMAVVAAILMTVRETLCYEDEDN